MRNPTKRFFALVFVFILALGVYILIQKAPGLFKKEERVLKTLNKESVDKVIISDDKDKIIAEKKNKQWLINNFPADQERIEKIIDTLVNLKKEKKVSTNKNKYADFGVDGKRKIDLDKQVVYIGKIYSYGKSYFRIDDDPNVYLADEDLSDLLSPQDFRDLQVYFVLDENKTNELTLEWDNQRTVVKREKEGWKASSGKIIKKEKIDFLLNDIKTLKGDDVFDRKKIDLSNYLVDLTIFIKENEKEKIGVFYKENEEKYYFYQEGANYIYQIPAAYVASLKKKEEDLVE
jgi:hypothetical protein